MTNEIKEILGYLKDKKGYAINEFGAHKELTPEENNKLLHYITNLQEENEHLDKVNCQLRKKINNDIYKQRIDKAVEYINKYEYQRYCPGSYEKDKYIMREEKEGQDLLDILRGDE